MQVLQAPPPRLRVHRGFLLRCDADERDLCCEPGEARPRPEKKEKEKESPSEEKEEAPLEKGGSDEKKEKAPTPKKETAKGKEEKGKAKAAEKEEAAEEKEEAEEKPKKAPPPKKPLSGYLLYCKDKREEFKAANPEAMMPELSKLMGAAWKALTEEVSAVPREGEEDKERYERCRSGQGEGRDVDTGERRGEAPAHDGAVLGVVT